MMRKIGTSAFLSGLLVLALPTAESAPAENAVKAEGKKGNRLGFRLQGMAAANLPGNSELKQGARHAARARWEGFENRMLQTITGLANLITTIRAKGGREPRALDRALWEMVQVFLWTEHHHHHHHHHHLHHHQHHPHHHAHHHHPGGFKAGLANVLTRSVAPSGNTGQHHAHNEQPLNKAGKAALAGHGLVKAINQPANNGGNAKASPRVAAKTQPSPSGPILDRGAGKAHMTKHAAPVKQTRARPNGLAGPLVSAGISGAGRGAGSLLGRSQQVKAPARIHAPRPPRK